MVIYVLIIIFMTSYVGECGVIQSFMISNNTIPTEGQHIQLTCTVGGTKEEANIVIKRTYSDSSLDKDICICFVSTGCQPRTPNYTCSLNAITNNVLVGIPQASRSDEGMWTCSTTENNVQNQKDINFMVYTLPSTIVFENLFEETSYLWSSGVTMVCKTASCTYKDPVFTWYYETEGTKLKFQSISGVQSSTASGCTLPEKIYRNSLTLPQNTTAPGNGDLTTKFQCELSFTEISFTRTTNFTPYVMFAVQVSAVTLKQGSRNLTTGESLEVTQSVQVTVTCTTGISKPPSTVNWFIGKNKQPSSNGPNFQFNPLNKDHGLAVYCTAYNLQLEAEAVRSQQPTLYVKVQVSTVTIKQGSRNLTSGESLEVTQGVQVTLTCTTGLSRPTSTINWFIGNIKQLPAGTSFQFNPLNSNHGFKVYCAAYNLQTEAQAVRSEEPKLFVKVQVSTVTIKQGSRNLTHGDSLEVTQGVQVTLTCTTGLSRPASRINWFIGSENQPTTGTTFRFDPLNRYHDLVVYCTAYNLQTEAQAVRSEEPTLYVKVQVEKVTLKQEGIQPAQNVTVTAGTPVTFTCTPGVSRPSPTIDWYIGTTMKQSSNSTAFSLNATNADHDKEIVCKAYNLQEVTDGVSSSKPKLYVRVNAASPSIVNGTTNEIILLDGDSYVLQCHSTATRPASAMTWKIGSSYLSNTESRETENSGLIKVISTVHLDALRNYHHSNITCQSKITGQSNTPEAQKRVTVYWSPDAPTVTSVNGEFPWREGQKGELNCTTTESGNPTSAVLWMSDIESNDSQTRLVIGNLSYMDNGGTVKCRMENSFTTSKQLNMESDEIKLDVQFSPKVFIPGTVFAGKPNENITISIPFLVNPNDTTVKILVNDTPIINNDSKYSIVIWEADVEIGSLGIEVNRMGYQLNFTIVDLQEEDFTKYVLNIGNHIGTTYISVNVTSESIPLMPTNFKLLDQKRNSIVLYWEKKFNGGHTQTFWIQVTEAEQDNWTNKTIVDEFDRSSNLLNGSYIANVTGLSPGTYSVRLFAVNIIGKTDPVMLDSSIKIASADIAGKPFPVGAAAGGGIGAAAIIVLIVIILVVWKRRSNSKLKEDDYKKNILTPKRNPNARENDDTAEINLNPMYESADTVQLPSDNNDVYAKVDKKSNQPKPGSSTDVYSQVTKSKQEDTKSKPKNTILSDVYSTPLKKGKGKDKKGKKEKDKKKVQKEKQVDGTVYENAETVTSELKGADNVYENPSCNTADEKPSRTRNEEGLIYIDVELLQQTDATNKTPVIHGEDRTIYADVAYGQVGEPMPESDEEKK